MPLARLIANTAIPFLEKYYRAEYIGLDNIPDQPFLGVGNHLGVYFLPETYLWVGKYHTLKSGPPMKVLVHSTIHQALSSFKFPEDELGILEACPENTLNAINSGHAVTVYPGGDRENSKPFSERHKIDFYGHHGYIKMAMETGAPILPIVGIGGGETLFVLSSGEKFAKRVGLTKLFKVHTWPTYWSFPCGWHVGHFPFFSLPLPSQMTISILPPYSMDGYTEEDTKDSALLARINTEITGMMQSEMDRLAKGRIPVIGKCVESKTSDPLIPEMNDPLN